MIRHQPFVHMLIFFLAAIYLQGCLPAEKSTPANWVEVRNYPAEFDPQEALWLIWPLSDHKQGYSNEEVTLKLIEAVVPHQKVVIACADSILYQKADSTLSSHELVSDSVSLAVIPSMEFWVRDMGPAFVQSSQGLAVADFQFDSWGYSDTTDQYSQVEGSFDRLAAQKLNLPTIKSNMISEGGNRESNGKGLMMVAAHVEEGRNPGWSRQQMQAEYKRMLGVEKIIWLERGLIEDDHTFLGPLELHDGSKAYTVVTTNGHIDEFARFVNDSTVVLAEVLEEDLDDPLARENARRLAENAEILRQSMDQNGQPLKVVRMPLPKSIIRKMGPGDSVYDYIATLDYQDGSRFPVGDSIQVVAAASYLNFIITNKVVIGQKYAQASTDPSFEARDKVVEKQLQSLFPNRTIIMIDALAVNLGGGGLHCISMHQPVIPSFMP